MDTPVLLILFNRPEVTRKNIENLRRIKPSRLYIACDGPRDGKVGETEKVEEVRRIAENEIDWGAERKFLFHQENLGCGPGPIAAINWFFQHEESGIILEDDCIASPSFFPFCSDLLKRFKNDTRISQINGNNYGATKMLKSPYDYHFVHYHQVWGWATWRRAWSRFQFDLPKDPVYYQQTIFSRLNWNLFEFYVQKGKWERVRNGSQHIWDVQWHYYNYLEGNLAVAPKINLVSNIGFGPGATHTRAYSRIHAVVTGQLQFPLKHPPFIIFDPYLEQEYKRRMVKFRLKPFFRKWFTRF